MKADWASNTLATERSIPLIPVSNISVEESFQRFCGAMLKAARHSITRGFRPTYTPCLDEECPDLLKQYDGSGDPDIADLLIESLDVARRHCWEELTSKMNFMHSNRKSWAVIRQLGAAQQPPKSTHPSVSANAVAAHLISSRLLKASHDKKFERHCRFVCRAELFCSRCQTSLPHPFTEEEISTALQEDETSDSPRLRQHPRGIPEEPGLQSLHLAVQILLQNHGYPFHPEDLEKGQGDRR